MIASDSFERNKSPKSPREIEAEGIVRLLAERDRKYDINLDFPRYLGRELASRWRSEGYGAPQVFVDTAGNPLIIGRHEEAAMYDNQGQIKPSTDVRYRFYLEDLTRDVTIPHELARPASQEIERGDVELYDANETSLLELSLRGDAAGFTDDLEWLKQRFGDSLSIVRPQSSVPRLDGSDRVVGVSLDNFPPFSEGDF